METHIKHWRGIAIEKPVCTTITNNARLEYRLHSENVRNKVDFCNWKTYRNDSTLWMEKDLQLHNYKYQLYGENS